MLIVVLAFAVVFICRDVQVLTTTDRKALGARFAFYAALILAATAIVAVIGDVRPEIVYAWAKRRFALAAVLIQLAELGLALALRRWEGGRHRWVGCILPCPAFLVVLFALSFVIQHAVVRLNAIAATGVVTACWLTLIASLALRAKEGSTDRKFADDFALMTSCTALIFVPYGVF
jgi:hypothetical protein